MQEFANEMYGASVANLVSVDLLIVSLCSSLDKKSQSLINSHSAQSSG
jgi:hypothetical protein